MGLRSMLNPCRGGVWTRPRVRTAIGACLLIAAMVGMDGTTGLGADASVTVNMTVPSATTIDASACSTGVSGVTSFGTVLPGTTGVTAIDCSVAFGSSNDSSALRVYQGDGSGRAMWTQPTGPLDPSFGVNGQVTDAVGWVGVTVAVQPDDKLIVAGTTASTNNFVVERRDGAGVLDASFGTGGVTETNVFGMDLTADALVQADGKVVVAGSADTGTTSTIAIVRYTSAGVLDATFGTGGKVTTTVDAAGTGGMAVAAQADGKLLLGGWTNNGTDRDMVVLRYLASGALDTTFGTGGVARVTFGSGSEEAHALAVQPDGRIVAVGCADSTPSMPAGCGTRYTPFAANSGRTRSQFAVARLTTSGTLDASFGTGGTTRTSVATTQDDARAVALQPDGRIVVAGDGCSASCGYMDLVRYNADGTIDTAFGTSGKVLRAASTTSGSGTAVIIDAVGNVLVGGTLRLPPFASADDLGLMRYRSDGTPDVNFGASGALAIDFGASQDEAFGLAAMSDGRIVQVGYMAGPSNQFVIAVLGAATIPDYAPGTSSWSTGAGMFGACLRSVAGGASTDGTTWATTGSCTASDVDPWKRIPTSTGAAGVKIASTTVGNLAARANLRFGVRTPSNQPPGAYAAGVVFEVVAPNA